MIRNPTIILAILLALACLGVAGYKLSAPRYPSVHTQALSACDPGEQVCSVPLAEGAQLTLSMEPRPIRPLRELTLKVAVTGLAARKIEVDFAGVDMGMGYNRHELSGSDGHFSGSAILPVCITGSMKWQVTVLIGTDRGQIAVPFHFDATAR